jgi:hypothetical protein
VVEVLASVPLVRPLLASPPLAARQAGTAPGAVI